MLDFLKKNFIFSRLLDYSLTYILGMTLLSLSPYFVEGAWKILCIMAVPLVWAPIGAFFLHRYGKTPGMWLFGLTMKKDGDVHLPWISALRQALLPIPDVQHGIEIASTAKWLRQTVAIVAALLCAIVTVQQKDLTNFPSTLTKSLATAEWVQYANDDKGFRIRFPTDPSEESKEIPLSNGAKALNITEVTSQKKKATYSLSYMKLPKKWGIAGDNTILKAALDMIIKHTKSAKLVSKEMTTHKEVSKAIDFVYKEGDDEVTGRLILINNVLYKITIKYPDGSASKAAIDDFINSFEADV